MWQHICEQISSSLGARFDCDKPTQLKGDSEQQIYLLENPQYQFFVKLASKGQHQRFESEVLGLEHLRVASAIYIPQVISCGVVAQKSYLVLEYLPFVKPDEKDWRSFGQQLAKLHQFEPQPMYGWQEDNYIGLSVQPNQWHKKWATFFAEQRIGYQLQLLKEKGHELANIDSIIAKVKELLHNHQPKASLLHGDLWQGNLGFILHQSCLFDPACYYGDRETDLAMSELFGQLPMPFYQGYNDIWPVDEGYEYRKSIYQLYHILNHALLFGGNYLASAHTLIVNLDA
ncbi:fructosamine kinase family protein [Neptunicella sp. SCSIO 80796]|uniref:fructosamine kinase family protein n=1 Tax=Neptunicella plasticusilytica TaxID=3117012 RepID=UPI003A4D2E46